MPFVEPLDDRGVTMPYTASDLFVDRLMEWGVDTLFGLPGDGINGFMEALRTRHDRIRYVHVRHEEVGAMAVVGYARTPHSPSGSCPWSRATCRLRTGRRRASGPPPSPSGLPVDGAVQARPH